jgi:hypothetical protein
MNEGSWSFRSFRALWRRLVLSEEDRLHLFPINCKEAAGPSPRGRGTSFPTANITLDNRDYRAECSLRSTNLGGVDDYQVTISADVMPANALEIARRLEAHAQGRAVPWPTRLARPWRLWLAWCAKRNVSPLPAEQAAVAFVDVQAEIKSPATVRRYIATIAHMHRAAELAGAWSGRRAHGSGRQRRSASSPPKGSSPRNPRPSPAFATSPDAGHARFAGASLGASPRTAPLRL